MLGMTVRQRLAVLVLFVFLTLGGALLFFNQSRRGMVEFPVRTETKPIYVHLCGAVAKPGIIKLKPGTRVFEALNAAGGALRDADLSRINLAEFVEDGEQIYLPAKGEVMPVLFTPAKKKRSSASAKVKLSGPLDLNLANEQQLEAVPGIGPALAARILQYRKEHGKFESYEQLDEVSGIGKNTLEKLRPFLYVK